MKIKITDLTGKIKKPEMKPLSDRETTKIIGGLCPRCPNPIPGLPYGHG